LAAVTHAAVHARTCTCVHTHVHAHTGTHARVLAGGDEAGHFYNSDVLERIRCLQPGADGSRAVRRAERAHFTLTPDKSLHPIMRTRLLSILKSNGGCPEERITKELQTAKHGDTCELLSCSANLGWNVRLA